MPRLQDHIIAVLARNVCENRSVQVVDRRTWSAKCTSLSAAAGDSPLLIHSRPLNLRFASIEWLFGGWNLESGLVNQGRS